MSPCRACRRSIECVDCRETSSTTIIYYSFGINRSHHDRPPSKPPRGAQIYHLTTGTIQEQLQCNSPEHVHIINLLHIERPTFNIACLSATRTSTQPVFIFATNCAPANPGNESTQQCQEAVRRLQERAEEEPDRVHHLQQEPEAQAEVFTWQMRVSGRDMVLTILTGRDRLELEGSSAVHSCVGLCFTSISNGRSYIPQCNNTIFQFSL
jgi:hypothetical protein